MSLAANPPPCPWAAAAPLIGDGAALRGILDLAGPETGQRILVQMELDLAATLSALQEAVVSGDFRTIRAQSHVLVSIVGTIGAMRLHAAARRLNESAHAEDAARVAFETAELARDGAALARAIGRIRAQA
ncbi:hypothetical protein [Paragemmobacter straminiformis]|uniref:Hpt domain-containing protein n=1 Tax=Paragemmobacter straminiformis TaxID=2045119 RepID=A0A842I4R5_9RHOB|nr:hypothetical protein [Gemmobacter straminiformis]MBC2834124.1 hypothetical protein [Gemmobacter straminiformis]